MKGVKVDESEIKRVRYMKDTLKLSTMEIADRINLSRCTITRINRRLGKYAKVKMGDMVMVHKNGKLLYLDWIYRKSGEGPNMYMLRNHAVIVDDKDLEMVTVRKIKRKVVP